MIQINLLPWREQERKQQQARFGIIVGVFAGFGLFLTVFFHMHYSSRVERQLQRNVLLQSALDEESNSLMTLNKKKKELVNIDEQLHYIYELRDSSFRAVRLLNELAAVSPDSITLYKIIRMGDTVNIFGKAKSNLQITLFMDGIEKSKYFGQPVLTDISGKENTTGEERSFQLRIQQQG